MAGCVRYALAITCLLHISRIQADPCKVSTLVNLTCDCYHGNPQVCSGNVSISCVGDGHDYIPTNLPADVVCLSLVRFNSKRITPSLFTPYVWLNKLDLSNNGIQDVSAASFTGLSRLKELDLSANQINLTHQPSTIFHGLDDLCTLSIQDNIVTEYRDDIFAHLTKLKELHMDGLPHGAPFTAGFSGLRGLRELFIYGNFNKIDNDTFLQFSSSQIEVLHIRSGKLYDLEPGSFKHFKHLANLSLSNNVHLGLKNMTKGWYGLHYTNITHLYLQNCEYLPYFVSELKPGFFEYLNESLHIKTLWLDQNAILDFYQGFHKHLPRLEALSLNCNRFQTTLHLLQDLCNLQKLTYLSLAYQTRTHFGADCLDDSVYLEHRKNSSSNEAPLQVLYPNYTCNCQHSYDEERTHWMMPRQLSTLIYKGSLIIDETLTRPAMVLECRNKLKYVDFSQNYISNLKGQLHIVYPDIDEEMTLIFDSNTLEYLDPDFFNSSIQNGFKLYSLSFFGNRLGSQIESDEHGLMFQLYSNLKRLNLGSNNIRSIPKEAFRNLSSLQYLNLTMNALRTINFSVSHMLDLQHLDLSFNSFPSLDDATMGVLDELARAGTGNISLCLINNPLICSCKTLPFIKWLKQTDVIIDRYENYTCLFEKRGKYVSLSEFYTKQLSTLERECASLLYLIAAVSSLGFAIIVGALSMCLYHHRWDIKFFLLHLRDKYRRNDPEDDDDVEYDAFVAYHQNDISWVRKELLENLENPNVPAGASAQDNLRYFRLCLHHRDFLPGVPIEENIVDCIRKSRKIILILSTSFVTSGWCDFELQMARLRCFDKGRDLIVVIMLEPVSARAMSKTLRSLIRRTTYIEWPFSPRHRDNFWRKVRSTLHAPEVAPLLCECGKIVRHRLTSST